MAAMLETPSRIWRRIEAVEGREMPSLPSMGDFDDSDEGSGLKADSIDHVGDDDFDDALEDISGPPIHSTPSVHSAAASRVQLSNSSSARFALSIASRSTKSSTNALSASQGLPSRKTPHDSFDVSRIPSLPSMRHSRGGLSDTDDEMEGSRDSVPEVYLPPPDGGDSEDDATSVADALLSVSQSFRKDSTPKKSFNISLSLRSEPKLSPLDKYKNVGIRRLAAPRMRTPSLTNTNSSPSSSPTHSTPRSNRSFTAPLSSPGSPISASRVPLPQSNAPSPPLANERLAALSPANVPLPRSRNASPAVMTGRSPIMNDADPTADGMGGPQPHRLQEIEDESDRLPEISESEAEREPTFSSDVAPTPTAFSRAAKASPAFSVPFSSPLPSFAQTPTPAYPRPRTRFHLPPPASDLYAPLHKLSPVNEGNSYDRVEGKEEYSEDAEDDPTAQLHLQETPRPLRAEPETPQTRRKSFLLAVINSTARPRIKPNTPHPRLRSLQTRDIPETPAQPSSSVEEYNDTALKSALQPAFTGVTSNIRTRARVSFPPVTQTIPESDNESQSSSGERRVGFATPPQAGMMSPYDGGMDRASFVSTASSHDLTTHQRANTSFDPAMGFGSGAPGQGVGRFNAGKLNNYLHGLNRQLQKENEALVTRIQELEEEMEMKKAKEQAKGAEAQSHSAQRRQSSAGKRVSVGGTLEDVKEDVSLEHWMEEKAELEAMLQEFKDELAKCLSDKQIAERELEDEKGRRARDRDAWRDKMVDVQKGVAEIIEKLEKDKQTAEEETKRIEAEHADYIKSAERRIEDAQTELNLAITRAEKAEKILENEQDLGGELREANEKVAQLSHELHIARGQLQEMEDKVARSEERADAEEKQRRSSEETVKELKQDLQQLEQQQPQAGDVEDKEYITALETGADLAAKKIEKYEAELVAVLDQVHELTTQNEESYEEIDRLQAELQRAQELSKQLEEALEATEQKMEADEQLITDLKARVSTLERGKQRETSSGRDSSGVSSDAGPTEEEYAALEQELLEAHKEIAKLTTMLDQSPARQAVDKAKDAKIEILEREREELLERNKALRSAMHDTGTPSKVINTSNISPIHRQVLNMSIKAPRTPGAPLKELSWLNSTMSDPSASPLLAEIVRLQRELDKANDSIDDKLDKLEDAGQGVIELTQKLEDAKAKIARLEQEIARLSRKEERRTRRVQRLRCQKCLIKVDTTSITANEGDESSLDISNISLPTEPPTPPTRSSDVLRANVHSLNMQLDTMKAQWEAERRKLIGEKAALQDTAKRLNAEIEGVRAEARRATESETNKANVQVDLARAKRTIAGLEEDLKAERERLRTLTTEQTRVQREKTEILSQLQNTEADMEEVKRQLQHLKRENNDLESELIANANAEKRVRILEGKVTENMETIEHLRKERTSLSRDHKELQRRFLEISDQANKLREQYTEQANQHDIRRHRLDMHQAEVDELRRALSDKEEELYRAESEKERMAAEKSDATKTVATLERDLRRVRVDAEVFGKDLRLLRAEREREDTKHREDMQQLERSKRQIQTQLRLANEQLEAQKEKNMRIREELKSHVCKGDEQQLQALKVQHNRECKGLIVQIKYLKAKFTRESAFRADLAYQKEYLLVLLSHYEKSERTIFAAIARIGYPALPPASPPPKKTRKLKSVAWMMIFMSRARRASEEWRTHTASKQAISAALQEVRQRRAAGPLKSS
ncbi:hypothetical protein AX16_008138 [Volvariella volvacea WC 439]|nr:hypothetical protein AX16_008138 [Volvariella volvacea WC 439]